MRFKKSLQILISSGITESEIASFAGVDKSTINRIRHGDIQNPSFETGYKIMRFYQKHFGG